MRECFPNPQGNRGLCVDQPIGAAGKGSGIEGRALYVAHLLNKNGIHGDRKLALGLDQARGRAGSYSHPVLKTFQRQIGRLSTSSESSAQHFSTTPTVIIDRVPGSLVHKQTIALRRASRFKRAEREIDSEDLTDRSRYSDERGFQESVARANIP
jgi:hypothetical protein